MNTTPLHTLPEVIGAYADRPTAWLLRAAVEPDHSHYLTPPASQFQLALLLYPPGSSALHETGSGPLRTIGGDSTLLLVRRGSCRVELFDQQQEPIGDYQLDSGDLLLVTAGTYRLHADVATVVLEVRQGPYMACLPEE